MTWSLATALLFVVLVVSPALAQPEMSEAEIYEKNKAAVVRIAVTGTLRTTNQVVDRAGTGFLIHKEGYVITAGHVVGTNADWQEAPNGTLKRSVEVKSLTSPTPPSVTVLYVDPQVDVALLRISCAVPCPTVTLGDAHALRPGIPVRSVVWNAPEAPEPRSGTTANEADWSSGGAIRLTTNNVEEGHSGAPLFDARNGQVIGMVKAGKRYKPGVGYAMSINLATSVITMTWRAAAIEEAIDLLTKIRSDDKAPLFPNVSAKFKSVETVLEQLKQNIRLVPSLSTLPNPNVAAGGVYTFLDVQLHTDFEGQYLPTRVVVKTTPAWQMTLKGADATRTDVVTSMTVGESKSAGFIVRGDAQLDDIKSVQAKDLPLSFPIDSDLKSWLKQRWSLTDATVKSLTITGADVELEWTLPTLKAPKRAIVRGVSVR